jgi:hypothetical protein
MEKLKNCWLMGDRPLFFLVLFVILVVPIAPLIKWGIYIDYLHVLFCRN